MASKIFSGRLNGSQEAKSIFSVYEKILKCGLTGTIVNDNRDGIEKIVKFRFLNILSILIFNSFPNRRGKRSYSSKM